MRYLASLLVVPAFFVLSGSASAVLVTGVTAGSGLGTVFTLNSAPVVTTNTQNNNTLLGGPGNVGGANTINIDINVLQKHVPFAFNFSVLEDGTGGGTPTGFATVNATTYIVNLTMTHMVPGSPGSAINGFDVTAGGSVAPLFSGLSVPLVSPFTVNTTPLAGGTFRFGGLNGGGTGQLLFGDSATSSFNLDVSAIGLSGPSVHTLAMTANPEPATMVLGGLAMIPAFVAVRRRRNRKAEVVS